MSVFTLQANMTRGELTPYMHARVDTEFYAAGLKEATNVVILRYGGFTRAPGTLYEGLAQNADKTARFIPFEFSRTQVYAIEAGDLYFRFWTPTGRIENPPGTAVEVVTPYLEADLRYIQVRQSGDVVYIWCRGYQQRMLKRASETVWTLSTYDPLDGPYLPIDPKGTYLTLASTASYTPTMTANAAPSGTVSGGIGSEYKLFDGNKGSQYFVAGTTSGTIGYNPGTGTAVVDNYWLSADDSNAVDDTPSAWVIEGYTGAVWVAIDSRENQRAWANAETRFYETSNTTAFQQYRIRWSSVDGGGDTRIGELGFHLAPASQTPFNLTASSTAGINGGAGFQASDVGRAIRLLGGDGQWRWAKIAAVTSTTIVTVRLYGQTLPNLNAIGQWALGAWSTYTGWPSAGAIQEDRLTHARTDADPLGIWYSVSAAYDKFRASTPGVDDDAISVRLTGGKLNDIGWLRENKDLVAGTAGSLRAIGRNNANAALSGSNVRQRQETLTPSSRAEPIDVENVLLFLDYYEQRLYESAYTYETESFQAREVSTLNEHLFAAGCYEVVYLSNPHKIVIARRYDGKLVAFTYDREQKVAGGTLIDVEGVVESAMALPGIAGTDLWMIVRRTINGSTVRYVERLAEFWRADFTVQDVPVYYGAAIIYDGVATGTLTGATHLIAQTVGIWADGRDIGDAVVNGSGQIVLPGGVTAAQVVAGIRLPWRVETLRLAQIGNQDGSGLGRKVEIAAGLVDLYESAGVSCGTVSQTDILRFEDEPETDPDLPVELRTGMFSMRVDDSWRNNGSFVMEGDRGYPVTVRGVSLEIEGEP